MRIKLYLCVIFAFIVLSAYFFQEGECGKKKKLLKAAKFLLLGAALKSKKTILPIPIPIPFKVERHVSHAYPEPVPYPVYRPYPEPVL
ncbi:unnamed protein product [Medioppia subpectinata]|uniref:Uncharacterized protein n=1 Tax=Medioppia subpectinata TaxID=1979941 RepID=A0A7R9Q3W2_9ACAR|nr:unnamed protein product [Medioppia subpectinata]CAG2111723.1 unnamed protein product [Medioppia subpectinata]